MVWPTLGSRTAKEQNRKEQNIYFWTSSSFLSRISNFSVLTRQPQMRMLFLSHAFFAQPGRTTGPTSFAAAEGGPDSLFMYDMPSTP